MRPEIDLLGLPVKTFGLMFALAFLACGVILARRLEEWRKPRDWAYEIVFVALVGGLVGAKVYYVIENYGQAKGDLLGNLFGGTGLVWYGGALGGAAGVLLWAWRRGLLWLAIVDLCAVPLAVGYAIGRIGCQLSGDGDYGKPWNGPWAMAYPHGTVPTTQTVHPTPVYETLAMGLLGLALWRLRDRLRPGALFALYLVGAGIERLLVEFIRRNEVVFAGLTMPQLESIAMAAVGLVWLAVLRRRGGVANSRPARAAIA
ncbi:MAG: prolipoprotein diacylglyceryl transferase [Solirubrobacteraceae bacterium]